MQLGHRLELYIMENQQHQVILLNIVKIIIIFSNLTLDIRENLSSPRDRKTYTSSSGRHARAYQLFQFLHERDLGRH